jgi:hypothetical protein
VFQHGLLLYFLKKKIKEKILASHQQLLKNVDFKKITIDNIQKGIRIGVTLGKIHICEIR